MLKQESVCENQLVLNEKTQPNILPTSSNGFIRSENIRKHHDNIESDNLIIVNSKESQQQQRPTQSRSHSAPHKKIITEKYDENDNNNHETIQNKSINQLKANNRWKRVKQLARNGLSISLRYNNKKSKYNNNDDSDRNNNKIKKGISLIRQLEMNRAPISLIALSFQKDENKLPRIPILASLLDIEVIKKKNNMTYTNDFYIIVQYGSIKWTLTRRYWDFVKLHYSYYGNDLTYSLKRPTDFPIFPKIILQKTYHHMNHQKKDIRQKIKIRSLSTCSSLNIHYKHKYKNKQHDKQSIHSDSCVFSNNNNSNNNNNQHHNHHHQKNKTKTVKCNDDTTSDDIIIRKDVDKITKLPNSESTSTSEKSPKHKQTKDEYDEYDDFFAEKQLDGYLNQLIQYSFTSGNLNRLCKFLEISTLGIYLHATQPNSSHQKEGYLMVLKRSDREPPRHSRWLLDCGCFADNTNNYKNNRLKWFIVQDNYIACVHHPHEMDLCDVILIDNRLQVQRGYSNQLFTKVIDSTSNFSLGRSTLHLNGTHGSIALYSKSVQQAIQFEKCLLKMVQKSKICQPDQRYNSFAPIHTDCPTTWFVDGKDYFFSVSVALDNAKESIYIHDWWLSPELYLRRLPSENSEWRLDQVLKRKADQGVKVYIIIYKEVAMTIPLFSQYAKKYLQSLSKNIFVQRHPSRLLDLFGKQSTLFWAHHEKICVVDGVIAFIGGLDLCFGRWDDAQHKTTDSSPNQEKQTWIGKDYSNPRIEDFHSLDKPLDDYLDRSHLPRMPWHDISVRICGSAVQDLEYHFIQRWNYLLRNKTTAPKRPTPLLIPRYDMQQNEYGLDLKNDARIGPLHSSLKNKVQILRSASSWSNGINYTEHSIQNAYVELIEESSHFIYIENQFFITSTKCGTTVIENKIGEALYQRILRAHKQRQKWHAIVILPLTPEFPGKIDLAEGATIRLIMNCQYLSISRGPNSLLERLRAAGVTKTSDYISFYGLRNWGELNGAYTTEQVYIHAKTMIVDDSTVLIGSANINERSMLGIRDSEICACIQDTEMIDSTLGGENVKVGKFAHSLRVRLMAEHIGLPVDDLTTDNIINKYITTNKGKINKRKDSMMSVSQDKLKCNDGLLLDKSPKIEKNVSPHHHMDSKNVLGFSSPSSSSSSTLSLLASKIDQQIDDMQLKSKSNAQNVSEMETLTTAPSSSNNNDHISYFTKLTTTHLIDEELILYCKKCEAWDTDTDNNGDGHCLIPLPIPISIVTSSIEDNADKDDDQQHANRPTTFKIKSIDPFTKNNFNNTKKVNNNNNNKKEKMIDHDDKNSDDDNDSNANNNINYMFNILRDPLKPNNYHFWYTRARYNTDLFRRCFMVIPENNIRTWDGFEQFHKMAKRLLGRSDIYEGVNKVKESTITSHQLINDSQQKGLTLPFIPTLLNQIKGHLVIWPLHFMEDEDDFLFAMDKIAPLEIFN